jgi:menaquinone-dependent protoporphyrinogen oxidase
VVSAAPYDAVVLGSELARAGWLPEVRELLESLQDALAEKPVWLFSVSAREVGGLGAPADLAPLLEVVRPRGVMRFGGLCAREDAAVEAWGERIARALARRS